MAQEKWLVSGPKVLDLPVVRSVKISLIAGRVDVLGTDEPTARVEVSEVHGRDLLVSIDGDHLEIDHPQLRWDNLVDVFRSVTGKASATVSVLVPRTVSLRLAVVSADALVSGMQTPARLSTASGSIMLDASAGDVELNTVSGPLSVRDHRGAVAARTVSGDVSASGVLTSFSCDGVSGDVFVDAAGVPDKIDTNTVSGATTIRLPEGVGARYTINSVSGTAQLDDRVFRGIRGMGQSWATGDLSGRWTDVKCNSVSGDIVVVRAATAGRETVA
ncbi:DUF4097 family beta strand repeat-containing protein [Naasia sp. SYSU D00948]|uniref:DUF4097 family beta strand repeat-containing protein n=1 Tax=Naasia sp. SYSU D00948 TaxID=2817379 RepID=UPI001B3087AB|nr:DUF4097 family beta strand repeat-containing protein [Naasia sp. SYSU D00948]